MRAGRSTPPVEIHTTDRGGLGGRPHPPAVHTSWPGRARGTAVPATVCSMTKARQALGALGERIAEQALVAKGMVVVDRNWRCTEGEVDLILRDGDEVVFCEVKTRRTSTFGTPAEAVVAGKVRRLRRLAAHWLAATRVRP